MENNSPLSQEQRLSALVYGLGLAIGVLEGIRSKPYDIDAECIDVILKRLQKVVEFQLYLGAPPVTLECGVNGQD